MPILNGEPFLRRALDSLLAQTVSDFELILSDNASVDETASICAEYARSDSRVSMIRQRQTLPGVTHFLFVLQQARGQYFMWAACDDEWAPTFIETLLRSLERNPGASGAFCPYISIDEMGVPLGGVKAFDYSGRRLGRIYKLCWHYDDACFYGLFRREAMRGLSIPVWWWINHAIGLNAVYPTIFFLLSRGEMTLADGPPLWFNRLHSRQAAMTVPCEERRIYNYLALLLRKINVVYESAWSVYKGSASFIATAAVLPGLFLRCGYECVLPFRDKLRQVSNRTISRARGRLEGRRQP
jgi:glycosyltransferase involved in cell wall biosynthesis